MLNGDDGEGQDFLRRRLRRAVHTAIVRLSRIARGRDAFKSSEQFRACLALARLAPIALTVTDSKNDWPMREMTAEDERLLNELERAHANDEANRGTL